MSEKIVAKFGGSSVANGKQIDKVSKIVADNPNRKIIVVSAPGRDVQYNVKITDHLFNIASKGEHLRKSDKISVEESKRVVVFKFQKISEDLGVEFGEELKELEKELNVSIKDNDEKVAYLASRGERFNAILIAKYLTKKGIKAKSVLPEDIGFYVTSDYLSARVLKKSYKNLEKLKDQEEVVVFPGFYGITENGKVAVFSRGGSDLTGGEIAFAIEATLYENWTDTDGVYDADPRIVSDADVIPRLTYKEIRLLSTKGFNVFHYDAMINCRNANIPINIKNTNRPTEKGTFILSERVPEESIAGIAKLDHMSYIYIEKDMLGEEIGFTQKLLSIFNKYDINTYHYPTDKDDIAVVLEQDDLAGNINNLRSDIESELKPDSMEVVYNVSIITSVGIGLKDNFFIISDAINVLKQHNIDILMLDLSPAKMSFHIGVAEQYSDTALRILHEKIISSKSV